MFKFYFKETDQTQSNVFQKTFIGVALGPHANVTDDNCY